MSTVKDVLAALLFFALILVSVGLHEIGHFLPGKLFKIKVLQYFIGFGKTLWSTKRGGTEYGVKMIPLGGFVRLLGMYPPYQEGKKSRLKRLADSARESEWQDITPDDVKAGVLFYQHPVWQRLIVMICGVAINFLVAFGLFLGVNLAGYGAYEPTLTVATVYPCVDQRQTPPCVPKTPAGAAGLQAGDTIVEFNGVAATSWADLTQRIRDNGTGPVNLVVDRPGEGRITLPEVAGVVSQVADPNDPNKTIEAGFLGVTSQSRFVRVGFQETLSQVGTYVVESVKAIVKLPVSAYRAVTAMVTGQQRGDDSPMSILGASRIAGEVATASGVPAGLRVATYLQLLASLNLFVALLNVVPLLPFDGGHVAAGLYEAIRRGIAKVRGRADPGPADTAMLLPIAYIVGAFLILVGAILIIADIVNPIRLF